MLRDPLARFLVLGALILIAERGISAARAAPIHAPPEVARALASDLTAQLGRPPAPSELEGAVARWEEDEALYREARARGLDRGDPVIRRRLIQSMRAISEAESSPPRRDPPEALISFEHAFSRVEPTPDWAERLSRGDAVGEAFPLGRTLNGKRGSWIATTFGAPFADALRDAPDGEWRGPVRSAYGWHWVRVTSRSAR